MRLSTKLAAFAVTGAAALAGADIARAQVTIGTPITPGVYGQIVIGNGAPPPLYAPAPVVVQQPRTALEPVYLYVPDNYRKNWSRHCKRYKACNRPVYFVNGRAPEARNYHYDRTPVAVRPALPQYQPHPRDYRHDNGRHLGWERGRGNPHRHKD